MGPFVRGGTLPRSKLLGSSVVSVVLAAVAVHMAVARMTVVHMAIADMAVHLAIHLAVAPRLLARVIGRRRLVSRTTCLRPSVIGR